MKQQNCKWVVLGLLVLTIALVACSAPSKPTIKLTPISGQINAGQEITVQATIADAKGVVRVEFLADNAFIAEATLDQPSKAAVVPFKWTAVAGQHTLSARAFSVDNVASDLDTMSVLVASAPAPVPTAVPTVAPTRVPTVVPTVVPTQPAPTPTPVPTPTPCANVETFVADVNYPDGSPVTPGQAFNKTWCVRNTGTCTWTTAYQIVRVSGERMSAADAYAIPATAPGATTDLTVPMTAPATAGMRQSNWQLRDPSGALFGTLIVKVNVVVPAPPTAAILSPGNGFSFVSGTLVKVTFQGASNYTEMSSVSLYANGQLLRKTPARTPSRQMTDAVDWQPGPGNYDLYAVAVDINGQQTTSAHISGMITQPQPVCQLSVNFRADRTTINAGEHTWLRWDVECAQAVHLDGQGVVGHDARDVAPSSTWRSTLRVTKKDGTAQDFYVTITVNQAPQPTPVPSRRNISGAWGSGNHSMQLTEAMGCGGPTCGFAGNYAFYSGGAPETGTVNGSVNVSTGATSLTIVIERPGASPLTFNGTLSADSRTLSGTLSGTGSVTFTKQ